MKPVNYQEKPSRLEWVYTARMLASVGFLLLTFSVVVLTEELYEITCSNLLHLASTVRGAQI